MNVTTQQILQWLEEVKDPEIPVLSLVDLGVITNVQVDERKVNLEMTPTFVGCPALDMMKEEIELTLKSKGIEKVTITVSFRSPGRRTRSPKKEKSP